MVSGEEGPPLVESGASTPAYLGLPEPTEVELCIQETDAAAAADSLDRYGFVIVSLPARLEAQAALSCLADWLGLGHPYVPCLYKDADQGTGLSDSYVHIRLDREGTHPSFASDSAQPMHVDGLLEPIGKVRTSALYCVRSAARGGRTVLFHACATFEELSRVDPEAAEILLDPMVLERFATVPGLTGSAFGPAFSRSDDGTVMTRFSDGATERWHAPPGGEEALARALKFLRDAYSTDGYYRKSARLEPAQCLVFRNDRLSHAREAFEDSVAKPRHLIRALYTDIPRSTQGAASG